MRIENLKCVGSTNEYVKGFLQNRGNMAVFADVQTHGRGTKGRSFLSDMGGVFLSILFFPSDMVPANSFRIMAHAAVAVCHTAEEFGISPEVKWPNDIRAGGRKLCGILIENGLREGRVDYSIVGIGLNVLNDVSALGGIAVSMKELLSTPPSVEAVKETLLKHLLQPSEFEEYLKYVRFLGKRIEVAEGDRRYSAIARRIHSDGRLEVEREGEVRFLSSAEIFLDPRQSS